jgi:hypothetical protein
MILEVHSVYVSALIAAEERFGEYRMPLQSADGRCINEPLDGFPRQCGKDQQNSIATPTPQELAVRGELQGCDRVTVTIR